MSKLHKELGIPKNDIKAQIILLNDLSLKMYKENDLAKKEVIRKELNTLSLATNSLIDAYKYLDTVK